MQPNSTQSTNTNTTVQSADTQAQVTRNSALDAQTATSTSRPNQTSSPEQANEQAQVRQLAKVDRDVRDHEAAHAAAGGGLAGAPSYSYTKGPDGQLYATGGEVNTDTSASVDPSETAANARTVIEAALAPANPSTQDLRVAAQARAQLIDAQAQLTRNEQQSVDDQRQMDSGRSDTVAEETQSQEVRQQTQLSQALEAEIDKALTEDEEEKEKDTINETKQPDDGSSFQENRSLLQEREGRIRQSQLDFAQELSDLNQRIQLVQQQLIETGEVNPASLLQGSLLDTQA
ncbi:MAG: putative metalloprotease CJM1_0395 family protein [Motiliproteus sp.]